MVQGVYRKFHGLVAMQMTARSWHLPFIATREDARSELVNQANRRPATKVPKDPKMLGVAKEACVHAWRTAGGLRVWDSKCRSSRSVIAWTTIATERSMMRLLRAIVFLRAANVRVIQGRKHLSTVRSAPLVFSTAKRTTGGVLVLARWFPSMNDVMVWTTIATVKSTTILAAPASSGILACVIQALSEPEMLGPASRERRFVRTVSGEVARMKSCPKRKIATLRRSTKIAMVSSTMAAPMPRCVQPNSPTLAMGPV